MDCSSQQLDGGSTDESESYEDSSSSSDWEGGETSGEDTSSSDVPPLQESRKLQATEEKTGESKVRQPTPGARKRFLGVKRRLLQQGGGLRNHRYTPPRQRETRKEDGPGRLQRCYTGMFPEYSPRIFHRMGRTTWSWQTCTQERWPSSPDLSRH